MSNELRIIMMALAGTAAAWVPTTFAAEPPTTREPGTLSREATTAGPAVNTSETPPSQPAADAKPAARQPATRAGTDRLNLDTSVVTGNRELPKVLYIVPWKKSDLGDLPAQPFNTLLDEALTPIDRDVFRREVTYYGAVSGGPDAAPKPAERSEK